MSHSHHEEGRTILHRPLWALEAAYSIVRNTAVTHTLSDTEAASFDKSLQQESTLPWVQAAIQATLPFGLYSPADSDIGSVCSEKRDHVEFMANLIRKITT